MQRHFYLFFILFITITLHAKPPKNSGSRKNPKALDEVVISPQNPITSYKGSYLKLVDLIHTKLVVTPDFKQKQLNGKAELTLKPHFYPQNELTLDAKWMNIASVQLKSPAGNKQLNYSYDNAKLKIDLDKSYSKDESFTIAIEYIAQPYKSDSINTDEGRGLYFIDVEDKNPYKPMHLWTQGETEASSCWFPTIDATNQKTSQEIYVTIDTSFISVSNGLLIQSTSNGDGTKTDYWKQDKPHAPYLFFLAVGGYVKEQDTWRDKEVSYYTFPKYKDGLKPMFKNLPEMMEFFSQRLGVDYPWDKLANVIAFDYTAGAMENTSAVLYYDIMFCTPQQLIDSEFDWIITHELFHQWFGDLVTAESWANLTLNESFADYSEYLWYEYKYGKDIADAYGYRAMKKYLHTARYKKEAIVNYFYNDAQDMFDAIRYEKGGKVLHSLRYYLGDDAFFTAIKKYLTDFKFGCAEISDLRKCFEDVSGEDLNWFFNQWWLDKGHPILDISHKYDAKNKTIELTIRQTQTSAEGPTFRIPTRVDIYAGGKKETKVIDITDRVQTFYFASSVAPQLVNFDADKVLVCEKNQALSDAENVYKFYNAPHYLDKFEALEALTFKQKDNAAVQGVFLKALQDNNFYLRLDAINLVDPDKFSDKSQLLLSLQKIINTDPVSQVREKAVAKIAKIQKDKSVPLLEQILNADSSFITQAAALTHLYSFNKTKGYTYAAKLSDTESPELMMAIAKIFKDSSADNLEFFKKAIWLNHGRTAYSNFKSIEEFLQKTNNFILERGLLFLKDIYLYEESEYNTNGAKQAVRNLKYYFEEKAKKDKQADIKVQIIKSVLSQMK